MISEGRIRIVFEAPDHDAAQQIILDDELMVERGCDMECTAARSRPGTVHDSWHPFLKIRNQVRCLPSMHRLRPEGGAVAMPEMTSAVRQVIAHASRQRPCSAMDWRSPERMPSFCEIDGQQARAKDASRSGSAAGTRGFCAVFSLCRADASASAERSG